MKRERQEVLAGAWAWMIGVECLEGGEGAREVGKWWRRGRCASPLRSLFLPRTLIICYSLLHRDCRARHRTASPAAPCSHRIAPLPFFGSIGHHLRDGLLFDRAVPPAADVHRHVRALGRGRPQDLLRDAPGPPAADRTEARCGRARRLAEWVSTPSFQRSLLASGFANSLRACAFECG